MGLPAGGAKEPAAALLCTGLWELGFKGYEEPPGAAPFILSPTHPRIRAVQGWEAEATLWGGGRKGPDTYPACRRGPGAPAPEGSRRGAATSTKEGICKCSESPRAPGR